MGAFEEAVEADAQKAYDQASRDAYDLLMGELPKTIPPRMRFWADLENPTVITDEELRHAEQLLTGQ